MYVNDLHSREASRSSDISGSELTGHDTTDREASRIDISSIQVGELGKENFEIVR